MERTYELKCHANWGKIDQVIDLFPAYRNAAQKIAPAQWRYFFKHGKFNKNLKIKTSITERFRQTVQYQVVGILKSFIENRKNDFVEIVMRSLLSKEQKLTLCYINKYNKWFASSVKMRKKLIPGELIKLARKVFKHVLSKHNKPSFKHVNMAMDSKVAKLSKDDGTTFDYWIQLSTLNPGKPIDLPLSSHHYFESQPGKICNFVQVNQGRDGSIHFCLVKKQDKIKYEPLIDKLSLDIGFKILFATQNGDLLGHYFNQIVKKYDYYITVLAAKRQAGGLRVRCKEYDLMVDNLREYIKNEINRCLNRLVEIYHPKTIVCERLNFTSPGLSRRMNRLLQFMGLGVIKKKLASLEEKLGIHIEYVNPAYTSQKCSCCGYVSKTNRNTRDKFVCEFCHVKIHADVNSSRNILSRSSDEEITIYTNRKKVLEIETGRFRLDERSRCPSRWARKMMERNPNFALQNREGFPFITEGNEQNTIINYG